MVQGVPDVWLDRLNVRYHEKLVSGMYKVYGRVGEDGGRGVQGVNECFDQVLFKPLSASSASLSLYSEIRSSCSPSQHRSRRAGHRVICSVILVLLVNLATTKNGVQ